MPTELVQEMFPVGHSFSNEESQGGTHVQYLKHKIVISQMDVRNNSMMDLHYKTVGVSKI